MKRCLMVLFLTAIAGCSTHSILSGLNPTGLPELHEPPLDDSDSDS
jgi:hypothetical protein